MPRAVHKTIAEGTAIAHPLRLKEMIHALKETGGESVAVAEDEIIAALKRLARLGLFVADLRKCRGGIRKADRTGRHQWVRKHGAVDLRHRHQDGINECRAVLIAPIDWPIRLRRLPFHVIGMHDAIPVTGDSPLHGQIHPLLCLPELRRGG